jgi:hypothetical protein
MKEKINGIDLLYLKNNLCYLFNKKITVKKILLNSHFLSIFKKFFLFNIYINDYYIDTFFAKYNTIKIF